MTNKDFTFRLAKKKDTELICLECETGFDVGVLVMVINMERPWGYTNRLYHYNCVEALARKASEPTPSFNRPI